MPNINGLAKPAEPASFALMVCTYDRPRLFSEFIAALRQMAIPTAVSFTLIVSDNNPRPQFDSYIGALLDSLPFATLYGHESAVGYSNARNKALAMALQTDAELLGFCDDDLFVGKDWLIGHLRSYHEFQCDGVTGAIHISGAVSQQKYRGGHGQRRAQTGMGNFSFKRRWISKDGHNLRFDANCNKTGFEDQCFTRKAGSLGEVIIFSDYPVVYDHFDSPADYQAELRNKAEVAALAQRNKVVALRHSRQYGKVALAMLRGLIYGLKSIGHHLAALFHLLTRNHQLQLKEQVAATKELLKMTECLKGLFGDIVPRQKRRRNH